MSTSAVCQPHTIGSSGIPFSARHIKMERSGASVILLYRQNLQGKPLVDIQTAVDSIGTTQTTTGLRVIYVQDDIQYELAKKVSDEEFASINLKKSLRLKVGTTEFYFNVQLVLFMN
jgi:hypothetical protein